MDRGPSAAALSRQPMRTMPAGTSPGRGKPTPHVCLCLCGRCRVGDGGVGSALAAAGGAQANVELIRRQRLVLEAKGVVAHVAVPQIQRAWHPMRCEAVLCRDPLFQLLWRRGCQRRALNQSTRAVNVQRSTVMATQTINFHRLRPSDGRLIPAAPYPDVWFIALILRR